MKLRRTPEQDERLAHRRHRRLACARRSLWISLSSIAGFVLVVGVGGLLWLQAAAQQAAAQAALAAQQATLTAELLAPRSLTPEAAPALLRRIEATRAMWEHTPQVGAIVRQAEQARAVVAAAAAQQSVAADLATLHQQLAAESKTVEAWQGMHDKAVVVHGRVPTTVVDLHQEVDQLVDRIDAGWFDALRQKGSAADLDPRTALGFLVAAEDLGDAHHDAARTDRPRQQQWQQRLRTLTKPLDAAMQATFSATAIAAVPAEDVCASEADWVASNVGNLARQLDGHGLSINCAGGQQAHSGVVVLRQRPWHACVLSFDLQLDRGRAVLFARTHTEFGEQDGGGLLLATASSPGAVVVPAGEPVHVEITVVGDRVVATVGNGTPQRVELRIGTHERTGGFAALVHPDTALAIRHLRIRRLG